MTLTKYYKNNCIIALYDTDREYIEKKAMRMLQEPDSPTKKVKTYQKYISVYPTAPGSHVKFESTFSTSLVKCLTESMAKNGGRLIMPRALEKISRYEKGAQYAAICAETICLTPYEPYVEPPKQPNPDEDSEEAEEEEEE